VVQSWADAAGAEVVSRRWTIFLPSGSSKVDAIRGKGLPDATARTNA
jgi:hypothetical protein